MPLPSEARFQTINALNGLNPDALSADDRALFDAIIADAGAGTITDDQVNGSNATQLAHVFSNVAGKADEIKAAIVALVVAGSPDPHDPADDTFLVEYFWYVVEYGA